MTVRALLIGLIGALFIAGFGYINNLILHLEQLTAGHQLPIAVFVYLVVVAVAMRLVRRPMRSGELAVATALCCVGTSIPARGALSHFLPIIGMPAHWQSVKAGWDRLQIVQYTPDGLLPEGAKTSPEYLNGFLTGLGGDANYVGLGDVPWSAWMPALSTWIPLMILCAIAMICMALVVHRQWSVHEKLRYPIAEVGGVLISGGERDYRLFANRGFWLAFAAVFCVHLINGLHAWYPDFIRVNLVVDFRGAWSSTWPDSYKTPDADMVAQWRIYFTVIAFSFFLASDISLSMGISQILLIGTQLFLLPDGLDVSTDYYSGGIRGWQRFGSYLAFALIVLYIGRRYYWDLLKAAFGRRPGDPVPRYAVWAVRIGMLACGAMLTIFIVRLQLPWTLAVLTLGLILLILLMVGRISAETGLFFIQPRYTAIGVLLGLMGGYSLGPVGLVAIGLAVSILALDPSQNLIPYFVNGLRMCTEKGIRPGRVGAAAGVTYAAGIILAIVVALWACYNWGVPQNYWGYYRAPNALYGTAEREVQEVIAAGELDESIGLTALERLTNLRPKKYFIPSVIAGFVLVMVVGTVRLRFAWWPIHPVLFLLWATYPMRVFWFSFLLGWLIKTLVVRLGGQPTYRKARPIMIGMIAGDLLGMAVFMLHGGIYYAVTGQHPVSFRYFPI